MVACAALLRATLEIFRMATEDRRVKCIVYPVISYPAIHMH